eukprot:COSAG05_NODE_1213_length_5492_cov_12.157983_2_plen_66_part_00
MCVTHAQQHFARNIQCTHQVLKSEVNWALHKPLESTTHRTVHRYTARGRENNPPREINIVDLVYK